MFTYPGTENAAARVAGIVNILEAAGIVATVRRRGERIVLPGVG